MVTHRPVENNAKPNAGSTIGCAEASDKSNFQAPLARKLSRVKQTSRGYGVHVDVGAQSSP